MCFLKYKGYKMFLRGISMKKLLEILRLHFDKQLSLRQISQITYVSKSTIGEYINLFNNSGLCWPLDPQYLNELALSKKLDPAYAPGKFVDKIDFAIVHQELSKYKHTTLQLLWEEYKEQGKKVYSYSHFALLYRQWLAKIPNYMRQCHKAGDKVFVDYSGTKVKIIDTDTGEFRDAEIFVGVLGASKYFYLEATWSQSLSDWNMSHVRMFEHFGGVPQLVIPDNLKSGVKKSHRYDPDITPAYYQMLAHYKTAAMPARVYTPKDKAYAENGVLIIERWILARLRKETIYGLAELNKRLHELMAIANNKKLKKYPETRQELFNKIDKPALQPLPKYSYIYREYKKVRVGADYHVEIAGHYYSVPYNLAKCEVEVWHNSQTLECYHNNQLVAKHIRNNELQGKSTNLEHMSPAHRGYLELTPDKMKQWSLGIGVATNLIVEEILAKAHHVELGVRQSHGFLNLSKKYGAIELEKACNYAICNGIYNYKHVESIIKNQLAQSSPPDNSTPHSNIRGADYYH